MKNAILQIKKLTQEAMIPQRGTPGAAGYDIFASYESVVPAKGKALIKTGLAVAVPTGNYARIAPRSGLAWKNFIDTGAGVIDEDYRGELGVLLFNHSDIDFTVNRGDRIAQMIIEKITVTEIQEVETLDDSERGAGGFGSTGLVYSKVIDEDLRIYICDQLRKGIEQDIFKIIEKYNEYSNSQQLEQSLQK